MNPHGNARPNIPERPFVTAEGGYYYRRQAIQNAKGTEPDQDGFHIMEQKLLRRVIHGDGWHPYELRFAHLLCVGMTREEYYTRMFNFQNNGVEFTPDDGIMERNMLIQIPVAMGIGSLDYSSNPFLAEHITPLIWTEGQERRLLPINMRYILRRAIEVLNGKIQTGIWVNPDDMPGTVVLTCQIYPCCHEIADVFNLLRCELEYLANGLQRNSFNPLDRKIWFPYLRGLCKLIGVYWVPSNEQLEVLRATNGVLDVTLVERLPQPN
ncbi:uncharacterized protein BO80DRAFT_433396 [Aspergillus ibericus CBS 121593]|uniref:Uncharacterized protein n=1 Tax=Aspergillus ibericus CBS 121593 TaxID=1448316 RepID=A0A395H5Z4_9EURO|nr:hypothetical protein BO80DRAFT_433396 [Aspergillus ibericus CBS 121593]RAL02575.1 hypothetical protein BO80DRAFT_433396 [Aspergillus ibericus CBS 121593]